MEQKIWFVLVTMTIVTSISFMILINWEGLGNYDHYHDDTGAYHVHRGYGRYLSIEQYDEVFDPDHDGKDNF